MDRRRRLVGGAQRRPSASSGQARTPRTRGWSRHVARAAVLALVGGLVPGVAAVTVAPSPATAAAAAPVGQGFNLNRSDLRFILKQIKISEQHASTATPGNPCGTLVGSGPDQVPSAGNGRDLPWGLRTVDGTCNNLYAGRENFGAANQAFPRLVPARFRDAEAGDPDGPGPAPSRSTSYAQKTGTVYDSQPRMISNLVVDQTATNPAAVEAAGPAPEQEGDTLVIPNVAPDVGLSAPYNSVFTLFGQFFDHGLDLTTKSSHTVLIPLKTDDPLYDPASRTNFMALSRATNQPGPDGVLNTADDVQEATNTTTPFVDQNQTYTSHPAHQVFLRAFEPDGTGAPVETGELLEGPGPDGALGTADDSGLAPWSAIKEQAGSVLGIRLQDTDVLNVPLLATDAYGNFTRGPNGYPQVAMPGGLLEGDPTANGGEGITIPTNALRTNHAFLDDIAHHAVPVGDLDPSDGPGPIVPLDPDADPGTGDDGNRTTYDDEMLGAHFVAGDGRTNENIGLTAIHHVFHSEHNRLVEDVKDVISTDDPGMLTEWQTSPGTWDGDRLFQAARFVTEMEYQHLVFEEFGRKVQPMVNLFGEGGTGYTPNVDPAIKAEFAHAVYRFGHSMLTETVARRNADGSTNDVGLVAGLPRPARVHRRRLGRTADPRRGGRQHLPRHVAPGRQRDGRVRHRRAAQQPARAAARPRDHQHDPRPRHRHPEPERRASRVRGTLRQLGARPVHELGRHVLQPAPPRVADELRRGLRHAPVHLGQHRGTTGRGGGRHLRRRGSRRGARHAGRPDGGAAGGPHRVPQQHRHLGQQRQRDHHHRGRRDRPVGGGPG